MKRFLKTLFPNLFKRDKLEAMVESLREDLISYKSESKNKIDSINKEMWSYKREVDSGLSKLNGQLGWRKINKKLESWENEHEFVEYFAVVYVVDDGYRKVLAPYLKADSSGKTEIDKKDWLANDWNGSTKIRTYMVSRLVLPGYFKVEDFLSNDSKNFTFEKMFGKDYQSLLDYMSEHNYSRNIEDMYSINFYEI